MPRHYITLFKGGPAEAVAIFARVTEILEKTLGPEHQDVASALANRAQMLRIMVRARADGEVTREVTQRVAGSTWRYAFRDCINHRSSSRPEFAELDFATFSRQFSHVPLYKRLGLL